MAIVTLGIDLAKNVFALHGVNSAGRAVLVRPVWREASCWNWSLHCRRA